jgi:hypothetical protein
VDPQHWLDAVLFVELCGGLVLYENAVREFRAGRIDRRTYANQEPAFART